LGADYSLGISKRASTISPPSTTSSGRFAMHCYKSQEAFPTPRVKKDTGKIRLFYENTNEKLCILSHKKILLSSCAACMQ
jgi:hypothetical protein